MSETNKDQDLEPVEETVAPEPDAGEEADAPAEEAAVEETVVEDKPARRRGNGVGWLALLLSLIALAVVGYTLYVDWLAEKDSSADEAVAGLESRLVATRESLTSLDNRLAELAGQDSAAADAIEALRQELDVRVNSLSALPGRMSTLESSVSSLAGISKGARDAWLIAEAEYYMQIANAQLQLANNPHLAARALEMADERVVQIGNPALIDVRRAISDELAALDVMEKPDIAGATLTLASLARVVESLPLAGSEPRAREEPEPADEEQGGLNRAWSSVKSAMSGLVRVTPPDRAKLALVSPDAEYFLRNNLALQLQSARLALLRGEQAVFTQTLDDTSALISQYFDVESAQVVSAQETLAEIQSSVFTSSVPDISGSLNLLRQFRTLSESSE